MAALAPKLAFSRLRTSEGGLAALRVHVLLVEKAWPIPLVQEKLGGCLKRKFGGFIAKNAAKALLHLYIALRCLCSRLKAGQRGVEDDLRKCSVDSAPSCIIRSE